NRAVQGQYPPASLIKPHLALLGLEYQVVTAKTKIQDKGFYQLKDVEHIWRDWLRRGHGTVDIKRSIEVSCDTFFYEMAYKLGIDNIYEYMSQFGFGEYTNIDLLEESDGNMPSRGWKRAKFNQPWYIGDTISVGIGQGYWTATPVQLLDSINTIINDGQRFRPQLLRAIKQDNIDIPEALNEASPLQVLSPENWALVKQAMQDTVRLPHGTAHKAFRNATYSSSGKTGTAQLFSVGQDENVDDLIIADYLKDNAMYLGYAPSDAPQISVIVALENAGGGGSNAAPISRSVMDYWLGEKYARQ
ncbi:MAG: penicillin-binding transpeptidase domain-containing protein, partial [Glaciecola sp.]